MKTTVSLPNAVFAAADALARRLGISRSRLYGDALAEYLTRFDANWVTGRLNVVYGKEDSRLHPGITGTQRRAIAVRAPEW